MKKNQNLVAGENVCFYQFAAPNAQPAFEDVEEKLEEALKNSSQFVKSGEHGEDSSKYFSLSLLELWISECVNVFDEIKEHDNKQGKFFNILKNKEYQTI